MHNFPKNIEVVCKQKHTLAQGKEILKLCIENGIVIPECTQKEIVDSTYPYFLYDDKVLNQTYDLDGKNRLKVTLQEFKQFIVGEGKYQAPFTQELKLNDEYKAVVTKEKITVGCQEFSHEIIKKLYLLSQKALKS